MTDISQKNKKACENALNQEFKGIQSQHELYKQFPVNAFKDNIVDWEQVRFPAQFWLDTPITYIENMEAVRKRNIKRSLGRK